MANAAEVMIVLQLQELWGLTLQSLCNPNSSGLPWDLWRTKAYLAGPLGAEKFSIWVKGGGGKWKIEDEVS